MPNCGYSPNISRAATALMRYTTIKIINTPSSEYIAILSNAQRNKNKSVSRGHNSAPESARL